MDRIVIVDANARGRGRRLSTLDVIGVGPRLVASLLKSYGYHVDLLPYELFISNPSAARDFDVLAVSYMVSDVGAVRRIIEIWRKVNRGGIVVLGGPGTLDANSLMELDFDIAFKGEVEVTFSNIFSRYGSLYDILYSVREVGALPGLVIKLPSGEIVDGGIGPWAPRDVVNRIVPDVDSVTKYPYYWASRVYVEVVRGCSNFYRPASVGGDACLNCDVCRSGPLNLRIRCPINTPPGCGYCSVPVIHGPARSRDIDGVTREVKALAKIGVTRIVLSAPDFLDYGRDLLVKDLLTDPCNPKPNVDAIDRLLASLSSITEVSEGITTISIENIKPCLINEEVAKILGNYLRGTVVYIGVESCSDRLLKYIGRPSTCSDSIRAVELLSRYGLRPYVYLMHGVPFECNEDIKITLGCIDKFKSLGVEKIVLYRFTPLPCTAFGNYPRPEPAVMNPAKAKLYRLVTEFNRAQKYRLVNRVVDVVIASRYSRNPRYLVSYPVRHGPVVLVRASTRFIGTIAAVRISEVGSDRLVYGELIHVKKRLKLYQHIQ
ncbi:MAG: B12-binding domain-containing radical SAM protein [Ignisphaera sp.]|nr:B12-binding domain-containing radical SAM protein [Ignisphaera sp.]MCX8168563.1 B12-binding domain-containing radical SAM protein [Ignisphaera sp.]MDW8085149.1 radical SAM protein [Ignisphaera sp.]